MKTKSKNFGNFFVRVGAGFLAFWLLMMGAFSLLLGQQRAQLMMADIEDSGYVSYQVDPAMVNQEAACYEDLSLAQQKQFLMEILDKNLLYVNACDLDDAEFAVSDADKRFTRSFYGEG